MIKLWLFVVLQAHLGLRVFFFDESCDLFRAVNRAVLPTGTAEIDLQMVEIATQIIINVDGDYIFDKVEELWHIGLGFQKILHTNVATSLLLKFIETTRI